MAADTDVPGEIAELIAREAVRFPDVVGLSVGGFGTLNTPVPGGHVRGVAVREDSVEVGVVGADPRGHDELEVRRLRDPLAGHVRGPERL